MKGQKETFFIYSLNSMRFFSRYKCDCNSVHVVHFYADLFSSKLTLSKGSFGNSVRASNSSNGANASPNIISAYRGCPSVRPLPVSKMFIPLEPHGIF